ncbi:MAG: universal stress protein [Ilumatobacteraceae bacterium]
MSPRTLCARRRLRTGCSAMALSTSPSTSLGSDVDLVPSPWWGAGWGIARSVPYGAVWAHRGDELATGGSSASHGAATEGAEAAARDAAAEAGLPATEAIGELGDPTDAILRAAEERDVDVIVVGSHQRNWFERLLRRSVTKELVRHAEIPVLVVR